MSTREQWWTRYNNGDRKALSRLITYATGLDADWLREKLSDSLKMNKAMAFTGAGGVGKSSLIAASVTHLRSENKTVAVLACDPQSPLTGGALLGDRVRLSNSADDPGFFFRSLAAAGHQQAITENLDLMIALLQRYGFDHVLIETVGSGQGDTAIHRLVNTLILILQPETGDSIQWEKAGLLEVADLIVINKADLPGAEQTNSELQTQLTSPQIFTTCSTSGEGVCELWQALNELRDLEKTRLRRAADLLTMFQRDVERRWRLREQEISEVLARWHQDGCCDEELTAKLWQILNSACEPTT